MADLQLQQHQQQKQQSSLVVNDNSISYSHITGNEDLSPDELLAYELNQLSFLERNTINEEVHGVRDSEYPTETPQLLIAALTMLAQELDMIRHKPAYELAQQLFPNTTTTLSYVNSDEFRLVFLRCEIFDVRKAAQRMVSFLELSYEICGTVGLERPIQLHDFDLDDNNNNSDNDNDNDNGSDDITTTSADLNTTNYTKSLKKKKKKKKQAGGQGSGFSLKCLKAGFFQILPGRDRNGRRIVGNFPYDHNDMQDHKNTLNFRVKAVLYMMMRLALDDVDSLRKGCVGLFWTHNWVSNMSLEDLKLRQAAHKKCVPALPIRFSAVHMCLSNVMGRHVVRILKGIYMLSIGQKWRSRVRLHTGSAIECLYALQTFGIQPNQMPINTNTGKIKLNNHTKYVDIHRVKEQIINKQNKKAVVTTFITKTKTKLKPNEKNEDNDNDNDNSYSNNKDRSGSGSGSGSDSNTISTTDIQQEPQTQKQPPPPPPFLGIECPLHNDVLFGRGWPTMMNPGNALFRNMIKTKLMEYDNANKKVKTMIARLVVCELKASPHQSRFLKEDKNGWWMEVSDEVARQKVSIGFRDIRKKQKKKEEEQTKLEQHENNHHHNHNDYVTIATASPSSPTLPTSRLLPAAVTAAAVKLTYMEEEEEEAATQMSTTTTTTATTATTATTNTNTNTNTKRSCNKASTSTTTMEVNYASSSTNKGRRARPSTPNNDNDSLDIDNAGFDDTPIEYKGDTMNNPHTNDINSPNLYAFLDMDCTSKRQRRHENDNDNDCGDRTNESSISLKKKSNSYMNNWFCKI